jgi:F-box-like
MHMGAAKVGGDHVIIEPFSGTSMSRRADGTPPIHRCPPELLSTIFTMSLPPVRYELLDEPAKSSRTLSQVCFRWRDAALSVSRLWNHITLSRWSSNRIEWLEELSRRSRQVPVSLRVWVGGLGWEIASSMFDARLSRLLKELMPRVQTLEVRLDCTLLANECAPNLMQVLRNHAVPLLESFHLTPFNNQRTTDYSPLDFFFNGTAPKLTSLRFDIHFSALHSSILLNVTTFCLVDGFTFTDRDFTWKRCLNLLKAMPYLENLLLTVGLAPDFTDHEEDVEEIYLSKLEHLQMQGSCEDCASLLKWIEFPTGCTFDIISNDTEMDEWCAELLQTLEFCISESEISSMGDYVLDIQVSHGLLRLLVHPPSQEPIYFVFSSLINTAQEEGEEPLPVNLAFTAHANSSLYEHLFLFARMIHRSDLLSQASEIRLGVDAIIPYSAPVFGSLVRACEQAKKIVLRGSENFFILPIIFEDVDCTFDAFFRGSEPALSSSESDSDSNPDSDSDSDSDLELLPTEIKKRSTASMPSTINFLYTDFDISTPADRYHFMHLVIWHQSLSPLIRDIFWPVTVQSLSTDQLEPMSMRDVMNYYLKPAVDRAV